MSKENSKSVKHLRTGTDNGVRLRTDYRWWYHGNPKNFVRLCMW